MAVTQPESSFCVTAKVHNSMAQRSSYLVLMQHGPRFQTHVTAQQELFPHYASFPCLIVLSNVKIHNFDTNSPTLQS